MEESAQTSAEGVEVGSLVSVEVVGARHAAQTRLSWPRWFTVEVLLLSRCLMHAIVVRCIEPESA